MSPSLPHVLHVALWSASPEVLIGVGAAASTALLALVACLAYLFCGWHERPGRES